jgi:hypothetical protein
LKKLVALLIVGMMFGACATRYRTGESGRSADEIESFLQEASAIQGSGTGSAQALALAKDPATAIYYAEGPGEMGSLNTVAAFYNLRFFSNPVNYYSVQSMKIFYLDRMTDQGHEGALIFDVTTNDGKRFAEVFVNDPSSGLTPGSVADDGFVIHLKGSTGQVIEFFSDDVDLELGELNSVIQGQISSVDSDGVTVFNGKIGTMIGFF